MAMFSLSPIMKMWHLVLVVASLAVADGKGQGGSLSSRTTGTGTGSGTRHAGESLTPATASAMAGVLGSLARAGVQRSLLLPQNAYTVEEKMPTTSFIIRDDRYYKHPLSFSGHQRCFTEEGPLHFAWSRDAPNRQNGCPEESGKTVEPRGSFTVKVLPDSVCSYDIWWAWVRLGTVTLYGFDSNKWKASLGPASWHPVPPVMTKQYGSALSAYAEVGMTCPTVGNGMNSVSHLYKCQVLLERVDKKNPKPNSNTFALRTEEQQRSPEEQQQYAQDWWRWSSSSHRGRAGADWLLSRPSRSPTDDLLLYVRRTNWSPSAWHWARLPSQKPRATGTTPIMTEFTLRDGRGTDLPNSIGSCMPSKGDLRFEAANAKNNSCPRKTTVVQAGGAFRVPVEQDSVCIYEVWWKWVYLGSVMLFGRGAGAISKGKEEKFYFADHWRYIIGYVNGGRDWLICELFLKLHGDNELSLVAFVHSDDDMWRYPEERLKRAEDKARRGGRLLA